VIDPHFREIMAYLHQQGITPLVATNGVALAQDPELVDFLYENGATVVVKIRSFDQAFQDILVKRP